MNKRLVGSAAAGIPGPLGRAALPPGEPVATHVDCLARNARRCGGQRDGTVVQSERSGSDVGSNLLPQPGL